MFVENHPETPIMRALNAGASTVFMKVCPVLKSCRRWAPHFSWTVQSIAGKSTVRFGAPIGEGNTLAQRRIRIDL